MPPEYNPIMDVPEGHESGRSNNLWTPTNVEYLHSWIIGTSGAGTRMWKHEFQLHFMGETETFGVMAEDGADESQIEDLAAGVSERAIEKILERSQERGSKLRPEDLAARENWDTRRDLAGAWREYRSWAKKRRASSTGKNLYKGLT